MIRRKNPLSTVLAGMALVATVLAPGVAWSAPPPADPPLITDPAGDAGVVCRASERQFNLVRNCGAVVPQPARPALDIVSGDINYDSTSLTFETTVVDLDERGFDARDVAMYTMTAITGNVRVQLQASRTYAGTNQQATVSLASAGRSVSAPIHPDFDHGASTLRWTVSVGRLNDLLEFVCAECREFRRGSTFTTIEAETSEGNSTGLVGFFIDYAKANRPYTIGDD